jgi:hypothetical protein
MVALITLLIRRENIVLKEENKIVCKCIDHIVKNFDVGIFSV